MDDELVIKLTRDLKKASETMTRSEARYLLDAYFAMQQNRKRSDQQVWAMENRKTGEPHAVLNWLSENAYAMEKQILSALNCYAQGEPMGRWAFGVYGVGPVVAAGLLTYIDMEPWKCATGNGCKPTEPCGPLCKRTPIETAGHIWAFAGLDPTKKWEKGKKRPHNAALKQICYYAGESFIKTSNRPESLYGKLYRERKEKEIAKNEAGDFAALAKSYVEKASPAYKATAGYKRNLEGKLGDGHLNSRARRYAVKIFLAHWFEEAYRQRWHKEPPLPYAIAILGHAHKIAA